MSTLQVDNFAPRIGDTAFSARSIAKVFLSATSIGTVSVVVSANVSSLTDNGVADITANFTNSFSSAAFAVSGAVSCVYISYPALNTQGKTTSTVQIRGLPDASYSYADTDDLDISVHGDLA